MYVLVNWPEAKFSRSIFIFFVSFCFLFGPICVTKQASYVSTNFSSNEFHLFIYYEHLKCQIMHRVCPHMHLFALWSFLFFIVWICTRAQSLSLSLLAFSFSSPPLPVSLSLARFISPSLSLSLPFSLSPCLSSFLSLTLLLPSSPLLIRAYVYELNENGCTYFICRFAWLNVVYLKKKKWNKNETILLKIVRCAEFDNKNIWFFMCHV